MNRPTPFSTLTFAAAALAASFAAPAISHAQTPAFTTVVEFTGSAGSAPGSRPYANVIQASDGNFYGTTARGGSADIGTIYKITAGGTFTSLRSFTGAAQPAGGLYPVAALAEHTDGMFYGTTSGDFASGSYGIAFRASASGTVTNFVFFSGQAAANKGSTPLGAMTKASDGFFYGTTQYGGTGTVNFGTIYKINPTSGALTTVIEFSNNGTNNKGAAPNAQLVDGGDGFLYGTTFAGGPGDYGTVFKLHVGTGSLTTLASFTNLSSPTPGKYPIGAMVLAIDGNLYGTTVNGGALNAGVVYRVNRTLGTVTPIVEFTDNTGNSQGAWPAGGLVQGNDGNLYGTTQNGGTGDHGTVYRLTLGGVLTHKLIEFTGTSGAAKGEGPYAGLIKATDGRIYGTTQFGGAGNKGTVFRLTLSPVAVTGAATSVTGTTATVAGLVNPSGLLSTYQFEYGTTTSYGSVMPLIPGTTTAGGSTEPVSASLSGLTPGTLYHFRLKATNSGGTSYGADATFTTDSTPQGPAVVTGAATDVTTGSATLNGTVNPNGNAASWQFEYGLTTSYGSLVPVSPGNAGSGNSPQAVSTNLTGLPAGTTIHYRLKAANGYGTSTGEDAVLTTSGPPQPPDVETLAATSLNGTSATLNATVNPNGSATQWQFEYGDDQSFGSFVPAVAETINGTTTQAVSVTVNGLTPGTTKYFRITATNGAGTRTGNDASFTTLPPPVAETQPAIAITKTGATLTGTVNPRGGVASWQFQYGPDTSYGSVAPLLPGSTGAGQSAVPVSTNLTSLPPGSTWHFRLVATRGPDVSAGQDMVFTTRQAPTVTASTPAAITATSATLQGTVNPQGAAATWQFDFGTTDSYGQSLPATPGDAGGGTSPQDVSVPLTGLQPNTTYHFRLRATSTWGTNMTPDTVFTTKNNIQGWRQQQFGTTNNSGDAANTADPEGDGVINLLEYAFGLNPHVSDAALIPTASYNGAVLIASFNQPAGIEDIIYGAEVSTNLTNWSPIADSGSGLTHTFAAPFSSTGRIWMRLRVTLIP